MMREHDETKLPLWAQAIINGLRQEVAFQSKLLSQFDADSAYMTWGGYGDVPRHGIPKEHPIHVHLFDGTEFEIRWFPDLLHIRVNSMNRQLLIAPYYGNVVHIRAGAEEEKEDVRIQRDTAGGVLPVDESGDYSQGVERDG